MVIEGLYVAGSAVIKDVRIDDEVSVLVSYRILEGRSPKGQSSNVAETSHSFLDRTTLQLYSTEESPRRNAIDWHVEETSPTTFTKPGYMLELNSETDRTSRMAVEVVTGTVLARSVEMRMIVV